MRRRTGADCRRTRLYGAGLVGLRRPVGSAGRGSRHGCPRARCSPRRCRWWRPTCEASSRPRASSPRGSVRHSSSVDMIGEELVRGMQALLAALRHLRSCRVQERIRGQNRHGLLGAPDPERAATGGSSPTRSASSTQSRRRSSRRHSTCRPVPRAVSGCRSRASSASARWRSTTSRRRAASTSPATCGCTTASSSSVDDTMDSILNWYRRRA